MSEEWRPIFCFAVIPAQAGIQLPLWPLDPGLGGHFDRQICSHDFGSPKEDRRFWDWLKDRVPYREDSALLIDDSLPVLRSARDYGIEHLRAVKRPDTRGPERDTGEFEAIDGFDELIRSLEREA